ncbi:Fic family protein [Candidatus Daviesbacteria bacterium]|nr:Fic family protein [Candidatus Daviesbacteria bacterium]
MDRLLYRSPGHRYLHDQGYGTRKTQPWDSEHLFVQWAKAVSNGTDTPRFHSAVAALYPKLVKVVIEDGKKGIFDFARSQDWKTVQPELRDKVLRLPDAATQSRRELIGLAMFVDSTTYTKDPLNHLGTRFDLQEFIPRVEFGDHFADSEDWLSALSQVVWADGIQLETLAKERAKASNLDYLTHSSRNIGRADIETIYRNTVKTIRPAATCLPVYRDYLNMVDRTQYIDGLPVVRSAVSLPDDMKRDVQSFLYRYNGLLENDSTNQAAALAWVYDTYLTIHPHPDYNGTITRTLIDHYRKVKGLPSIDWFAIKKDPIKSRELDDARYARARESDPRLLEQFFRKVA